MPPVLADFIQKEQGEYTDISADSLRVLLYDFRRTLTPAEKVTGKMPASFIQAWKQIEKKLPELKELAWLYQLQKERIGIDVATERQIKKLFVNTGKEIDIAAGLLDKSIQAKLDLGVKDRELGHLSVDGQGDRVAVLQNTSVRIGLPALEKVGLNAEGRRRVLDLVDMTIRMGSRANIEQAEEAVDAAVRTVPQEPVQEAAPQEANEESKAGDKAD